MIKEDNTLRYVFLTVALFIFFSSKAQEVIVSEVTDGDTIRVYLDTKLRSIRLKGIDAPELNQTYGDKSTQALVSKILNQRVTIEGNEFDSYGRQLADVKIGDRWINRELVEEGYAWHYKYYSDDKQLADAEMEAKKELRGLWNTDQPIPPWEYRKATKYAPKNESVLFNRLRSFFSVIHKISEAFNSILERKTSFNCRYMNA